MKKGEKIAAITIDMDHETDYARVYDQSPVSIRSEYLYRESIPRILALLKRFNIKATFFIVGRDLQIPFRRRKIARILGEGHELGNHTFSHHHNFHLLSRNEKYVEIAKTHDLALKKLHYKMIGFRAPGYNIDGTTIQILHRLGYRYDSSIHPTILHPLLRFVLFLKTKKKSSLKSMGPKNAILASITPYRCSLHDPCKVDTSSNMLEIPISVLPIIRLPYFGTIDLHLGKLYILLTSPLRNKLSWTNYEIHGIDLIDAPSGDFAWFAKHPGMHRPAKERMQLYENIFKKLSMRQTVTLREAALRSLTL